MKGVPGSRSNSVSTLPPPRAVGDTTHTTSQIRSVGMIPSQAPRESRPALRQTQETDFTSSSRRMFPSAGSFHGAGSIVNDKYQLLRPLGAGGMGEIWVAHHLGLDIDVAVKFIGEAGAPGSALAERLLDEARNTARLGHPAIVRALDFGHTERGDPFIVLELLAGEDLATRLDRDGPLDPVQAVAVLLPVVHALVAVHESGIVHRDIKPENVFLSAGELGPQAKLLDFGISRKTDRARRLTASEVSLGTPDYMSPEQALGEQSDARTDQWSLCVVLYETVTRNRPFEADNHNALLRAIIERQARPLALHGLDEPELWQILERGLSKSSCDRYRTIRDLGEALAGWLLSRGITEDAMGTSLRRTWLKDDKARPALGTPYIPGALSAQSTSNAAPAPRIQTQSFPNLQALADLHRGGDPELRLRRDAQRRVIQTLIVMLLAVCSATLAILIGTGVLVLW